jgi:hypothetical protein
MAVQQGLVWKTAFVLLPAAGVVQILILRKSVSQLSLKE